MSESAWSHGDPEQFACSGSSLCVMRIALACSLESHIPTMPRTPNARETLPYYLMDFGDVV